ncbi:DUF6515 family protein [Flavobacterium silvaticum]|uniref:DUF3300 domain-containing protein n=1 Tax=Flavobacterium silvaticum TaxID=1852020 RepID=A0A972FXD6_9FLAO|nr:DUF6515 family protein [Flavobacterium silvaticum]NMH26601.1 hypothetical protein [Flavobacterium silvaticum]
MNVIPKKLHFLLSVIFCLVLLSSSFDGFSQNRRGGSASHNRASKNVSSRNKVSSPKKATVNRTDKSNRTSVSNRGNNKVSVDKSKRNVNVNVDRSKNIQVNNNRTVVRRNTRVYSRPPHIYGGHRYYAYHPYHYHPYRPYYWGPVWHPWGFFVTTLATTAIIVSIHNHHYHYDHGVYYVAGNGGYTVVEAPVGATITTLPESSQTVVVNETTNNYYYGGTFYEKSDGGYTVVPPTAGTLVENLPEGATEEKIGDQTYVKLGETYYQPIEKDGKNMYEVVQVEQEDEKK